MNGKTSDTKTENTNRETGFDSTSNVVVMADYIARTGGRRTTKEDMLLPSLKAKQNGAVIYLIQKRLFHRPLRQA